MAEILVAGGRGLLGTALVAGFQGRAVGMDLPELDVTSASSVVDAVRRINPKVIINTAALTDVDHCQLHARHAFLVHRDGVRNLAETGVRLVTFSTDHVFSRGEVPIPENARVNPANVYGESKLQGEREALAVDGNTVIRISWLFSDQRGIPPWIYAKLSRGGIARAIRDQTACVTYVPHLVEAVAGILESGESGLLHCVNPGATTPCRIAETIRAKLGRGTIDTVAWKDLGLPAPRPSYSALCTLRSVHMPPLEEAMEEWMKGL